MFAASKTASVSGGYQISRSLRFNSADSAYLVRAPATTTNRRTFTWSAWVKRSEITPYQSIFSSNDNTFAIAFGGDQQFQVFFDVGAYSVNASNLMRDPSAWYHLVVGIDTTQATAANRVKMYVNGTQITSFASATYPPQNFDTAVNQASSNHRISAGPTYASNFFGGYQTEIYLIDGQQLTPSSFGETNVQTGVWGPKAYSGSYGTNGFYVNFSDNSNNTATTLGKDYSGNGNNFTPTNLSVTAGAGNDSLVDSPTSYGTDTGVGGTVRGNYATLNPLDKGTPSAGTLTLSNGNLDIAYYAAAAVGVWSSTRSTMGMSSGQWYWEITATNVTSAFNMFVGVATSAATLSQFIGYDAYGWGYYSFNGNKRNNNSPVAYGASWTTSDIIGIAFDADTATLTFYKNGTSQGVAYSSMGAGTYFPAVSTNADNGTTTATLNMGQRPFAYTAPSGFKALCTQNLPTPTIGATTATQAGKYFGVLTYTGNGSATQAITGLGFQPDFSWVKNRSNVAWYAVVDAVRTTAVQLDTTTTTDESNSINIKATYGGLSSFDSGGITVSSGSDGTYKVTNGSGQTYVAWNWKANGAGSTNTSGSITSTVSASTTSGFSVVTWTGSSAGQTVGHGLGVAPSLIIAKSRSSGSEPWPVYISNLGVGNYLLLNSTAAANSTYPTYWGSSAPTSTVFGTFTGGYPAANNNGSMVAYCFAPIAGYSAFGSYTGNGSSDGPFVYTGFRPAFLMIKRSSSTGDWFLYNNKTSTYNVVAPYLVANTSGAEGTYTTLDFVSNGFKLRVSDAEVNGNGSTFIYMAFAEAPQKFSLAR